MQKMNPLVRLSTWFVCLVLIAVGFFASSTSMVGTNRAEAAPGAVQEPARQEALSEPAARPGVRRPGIYVFWDYVNLDPQKYPIVGSHQDFSWTRLEPTEGNYRWDVVDRWVDDHIAYGKYVGIAFDTYGGIDSKESYATPDWLFAKYPHLKVNCDGYIIPRYWHPDFLAEYEKFVSAVGARYDGDPRIEWVQVAAGLYGETQPAENQFDSCLEAAGLTSDLWVETVNRIVDMYVNAFPRTTLFLQYAPTFIRQSERRRFTDYAASRGVGLKHNGLRPDGGDGMIIDNPDYSLFGAGQYDPMFKWWEKVPIAWESYDNLMTGVEGTLWGVYSGLNKHADYFVFSLDVVTDPNRFEILEFANEHLGRTLEDTPSVWVALRETEGSWYPQYGNYDFWLYQNDDAPGGKTVPLWRVGSAPEGRYTRRTDEATDNPYMYFDVDNGYIYGGTNRVTINVIYYDQGTDTWELQYDAVGTDNFKSAGIVRKTNTRTWKKVSFELDDAEFADGQPGGGKYAGSDFRIWSRDDGDEIIHFVQVIRKPGMPVTVSLQEGVDGYQGTADTFLSAWQPTSNFGKEARIAVRSQGVMNGLLQFDLSSIPARAPVTGATLHLYRFNRTNGNPMDLEVYGVRRSWQESQATWQIAQSGSAWGAPGAEQPQVDRDATPVASVPLPDANGWVTVDVTSLVRDWAVNPLANYGLLLKGQSEAKVEYSFYSSDAIDPSLRPRLVVTYTVGGSTEPTPTPTLVPTSTPVPPGQPTPTPTPTSQLSSIVLQEGVGSYNGTSDTWLSSWSPGSNYGRDVELRVRSRDQMHALLRFDLEGRLPAGAVVTKAWLDVYPIARSNSNTQTLEAYEVLRSWNDVQATWQQAVIGGLWSQPGANGVNVDRAADPVDSVNVSRLNSWVSLDVTSLVAKWLANPSSNHGILLKGPSYANVRYTYASSEAENVSIRPRLRVTYYVEGGPGPTPTSAPPTATPTPTVSAPTATPSPGGSGGWELSFTVPKAPPSLKVWWIDFPSRNVGYAVGGPEWTESSGTAFIYKTTDGGRTWTEVEHPATANRAFLSSVDCKDENTCWVVGRFATIMRTTNGGASWQKSPRPTDRYGNPYGGFLYSVRWTGTGNTVLVGTTLNFILRSTDGYNFGPVPVTNNFVVRDIECPTTSVCFAAAKGRLYYSWDGGAHWGMKAWYTDQQLLALDPKADVRYAYGISFVDKDTGWIVATLEDPGPNDSPGIILKISNATSSSPKFELQAKVPVALERVQMVNDRLGYAIGWEGHIYRTTDGQTWQRMDGPPTTANLMSLYVFGEDDLWVGDDQGHIWHYGGGSGQPLPTSTPVPTATWTSTPVPPPGGATVTPTPTVPVGGTPVEVELVAGADTYLNAWSAGTNYGGRTTFRVRSQDVMHGLVWFDVSKIPSGVVIQEAELRLFQNSRSNGNALRLEVYGMRRGWEEKQANWDWARVGERWGVAGAVGGTDRDSEPVAMVDLNQDQGYVRLDVRALVQAWVNGERANEGMQLRGVSSGKVEYSFASRENSAMAYWPRLRVKYTTAPPPTPTPTYTPTPTATLPSTPTPVPTATPTNSLPDQRRRIESHYTANPPVIDGDLSDWGGEPTLVLDVNTARYVNPRSSPAPSDVSLTLRSRWDQNYLYLAIQVVDDIIVADSTDIWRDDGVELGFDGSNDDAGGSADDHQFTFAVDGRVTDFGVNPVPDLISNVQTTADGYIIEIAVPKKLLGGGNFYTGQVLGFTVGLHDDDDGGDWDSYLIWEGTSTISRQNEFGDLALVGAIATPTPTPSPTPTPTPLTIVVQHGVSGNVNAQDTFINAWSPGSNYGSSTGLKVRSRNVMGALLFFDLDGVVPDGARVIRATLDLYQYARSNSNPLTLEAYGVKRPWSAAQATWEYAQAGQRWGQPGANDVNTDRDAEPTDSTLLERASGWASLDVTAIVQRWVDGANYGVLLKGQSPGAVEYRFYSSEWWQPEMRPRLTIQYVP